MHTFPDDQDIANGRGPSTSNPLKFMIVGKKSKIVDEAYHGDHYDKADICTNEVGHLYNKSKQTFLSQTPPRIAIVWKDGDPWTSRIHTGKIVGLPNSAPFAFSLGVSPHSGSTEAGLEASIKLFTNGFQKGFLRKSPGVPLPLKSLHLLLESRMLLHSILE